MSQMLIIQNGELKIINGIKMVNKNIYKDEVFRIANICYILHLQKRFFIRTYTYANAKSKVKGGYI